MGDTTAYEPAGDRPTGERRPYQSRSLLECISSVATPRGAMPILKTMVTTACERNCFYCPFRAGRGKTRRVTFSPAELAAALNTLTVRGNVRGMFLSSGIIKGSVTTQDKIIDTAEIVRSRYGYRGYLHLKVMPGAEHDQIARMMRLADRVSINLEGPTPRRLEALAPKKDFFSELVRMIEVADQIRRQNQGGKMASLVTQFVVGAVGETDLELLSISERLYRERGLARIYYSGFNPVDETPFENLPPVNPWREFRLYQSSFLLRSYHWDVEELPFLQDGNLRLDVDPKRAWADAHLRHDPIDLMKADREQLLRVPGIGPVSANKILRARKHRRITDLADLRQLAIRAPEQAAPYVLLDGARPPAQLSLW